MLLVIVGVVVFAMVAMVNVFNRLLEDATAQRLDGRMDQYGQEIRDYPNHASAYLNRGRVYDFMKQFDRAIADYDQVIRLDPKYAVGYNLRGESYRRKGDPDRAIADYDEAIRLVPSDSDALNNRAMAYDQKGDCDRAIGDLNEAIRLVPKYVIFYGNRGDVYRHKGDPDRAVADYSEVLRLIPEGASSQYSDRQHVHGSQTIGALINLLLLRGNIGRPGAGCQPIRGHSNVQGQRSVGVTEKPELAPMAKYRELFGFEPPLEEGNNTVAFLESSLRARRRALSASAATSPAPFQTLSGSRMHGGRWI